MTKHATWDRGYYGTCTRGFFIDITGSRGVWVIVQFFNSLFYEILQACRTDAPAVHPYAPFRKHVRCHMEIKTGLRLCLQVRLHVLFLPEWHVTCECGRRISGGRLFFPPLFSLSSSQEMQSSPSFLCKFQFNPWGFDFILLNDFSMKILIIFNYAFQLKIDYIR